MRSSKKHDTDGLLDQPKERRALKKKDIFVKCCQENLSDIVSAAANTIVFSNFFTDFELNDTSSQPVLVQVYMAVTDVLTSKEYKAYDSLHSKDAKYMYHNSMIILFNIFSQFLKVAKNRKVIR